MPPRSGRLNWACAPLPSSSAQSKAATASLPTPGRRAKSSTILLPSELSSCIPIVSESVAWRRCLYSEASTRDDDAAYPRSELGPRRHRWCFAWTRHFDRAKVGSSSYLQLFHVLRIVEQIVNYARTLMNAIAGPEEAGWPTSMGAPKSRN